MKRAILALALAACAADADDDPVPACDDVSDAAAPDAAAPDAPDAPPPDAGPCPLCELVCATPEITCAASPPYDCWCVVPDGLPCLSDPQQCP